MVNQFVLTQGPSREQLFDCLRLGPTVGKLRVLDFRGEYKHQASRGSCMLPIEIDGLCRASNEGDDWFFWGRRKQITSGDKWVPMWKSKYVGFAFGRWITSRRCGVIKFGDTSFFVSPVSTEEMAAIRDYNI